MIKPVLLRPCLGLLALLLASRTATAAIIHVEPATPLFSSSLIRFLDVDFDSNGVVDLEIRNTSANLDFLPTTTNRIISATGQGAVANLAHRTAVRARIDENIGSWEGRRIAGQFSIFGPQFQTCGSNGAGRFCLGYFLDGEGYFGFEFDIYGQNHYGWARAAGHDFFLQAEIFEWAYESTPGAPIAVGAIPEPGSELLGGLAIAALGLRRRRR